MFDARNMARELCAKLDSHTTSVNNVALVAEALEKARVYGRDETFYKNLMIGKGEMQPMNQLQEAENTVKHALRVCLTEATDDRRVATLTNAFAALESLVEANAEMLAQLKDFRNVVDKAPPTKLMTEISRLSVSVKSILAKWGE